jgi:hypothetical protein
MLYSRRRGLKGAREFDWKELADAEAVGWTKSEEDRLWETLVKCGVGEGAVEMLTDEGEGSSVEVPCVTRCRNRARLGLPRRYIHPGGTAKVT